MAAAPAFAALTQRVLVPPPEGYQVEWQVREVGPWDLTVWASYDSNYQKAIEACWLAGSPTFAFDPVPGATCLLDLNRWLQTRIDPHQPQGGSCRCIRRVFVPSLSHMVVDTAGSAASQPQVAEAPVTRIVHRDDPPEGYLVEWQVQSDGIWDIECWATYDSRYQSAIEACCAGGGASYECEPVSGHKYRLDFRRSVQVRIGMEGVSGSERILRRIYKPSFAGTTANHEIAPDRPAAEENRTPSPTF